ncbi:HlyD family secretion protein [Helicobacter sp. 11S02596-1]|uniref:HlyD family secretion protein n=1 Tax=Helicobacter sp. 11S02596-1 TaxID=1476194 RepID=UPI000BA4F914|nr:HlyD family secretion protein [Helicobacter sp. 11S02596-1]PAF44806.1 secretion protein HlyD [Helicobacter sp. 11S02596-1]
MPFLNHWRPKKPNLFTSIIATLMAIAGILCILYAWELPPFFRGLINTNDAYVQSKVTLISPRVSGYVTQIYAKDFATLKAGDPILQIDPSVFIQKVNEAKANLESAESALMSYDQNYQLRQANLNEKKAVIDTNEATYQNAMTQNKRVAKLVKNGSLSQREFEDTQTALKKAKYALEESQAQYKEALQELKAYKISKSALEADVKRASAALELAKIDLDYSLIKAPVDGQISEVGARLGQFVSQGTPLTFLIPHLKWVQANFKETKMKNVQIGQRATFRVDALGGAELQGVVEDISPATGSQYSAIKVNNATGNFIKVIQRIPVRIRIDTNNPLAEKLKPGMSVIATIHTQGD